MSRGVSVGGHTRPHRGISDEWLTPPEIVRALGTFDLDPAAPVERPWPTALRHFTMLDHGLLQSWEGRVWLNPPYGPETARWLRRLADHGRGTALIFARTETAMFFESVWRRASALLFLEGRLVFRFPDGRAAPHNSGGPSVLVAYGAFDARALKDSGVRGAFIEGWRP